jgi:RNA polymerase sigma-70 factor, ECF subfamily
MPELRSRLAAGEERALEEAMALFWDPLLHYASSLLPDRSAAEDTVQTAFLRLWENRAGWNGSGSLPAFLYRTVRNLSIDERRRERVRRLWASRPGAAEARTVATPLEEAGASELAEHVQAALASLPPRRREVLELARFQGLSYREIGEVMGISPQTVANQMSAALDQLRRDLRAFL